MEDAASFPLFSLLSRQRPLCSLLACTCYLLLSLLRAARRLPSPALLAHSAIPQARAGSRWSKTQFNIS
eukprot:6228707-Pyramimonas_sp.AAC.1